MGLWYRDLACVVAGAPDVVHHSDRADELRKDAEGREAADLDHAVELVDDVRARLLVNVDERLACEALVYRLERTFSRN
jgi:DNA polymerase III subunit delta'